MAEGAPLLREYRVLSPIEGSNPSVSAKYPCKSMIYKGIVFSGSFDPTIYPTSRKCGKACPYFRFKFPVLSIDVDTHTTRKSVYVYVEPQLVKVL